MSLHTAKLFIRPLALAAAALFFHTSVASAADSTADIQEQMKGLLAGTIAAHVTSQSGPRDGDTVSTRAVDSQELVKQLLLGTTNSSAETSKHSGVTGDSSKTQARERSVAHRDSQAAVRHVLLGQSHASDAS
jgi:hypothetical protein